MSSKTRTLIVVTLLGGFLACSNLDHTSPQPPTEPEGLRGRALAIDFDLKAGSAAVRSLEPAGTSAASFALLGRNEVSATIANLTRSRVGEFTPLRVRVRFDLVLSNRLANSDLVPSTFPAPPVAQVVAFPFATVPAGLFGLKVRASTDWSGNEAPGSGAPFDFFNDAICIALTPPSDCFRWEAFGAEIAAGRSTIAHGVGFDVDPSVSSFTLYVAVAADIRERQVAAGTGVAGTVVSAARGPLENVTVNLGSRTAVTSATGLYTFGGLAAGAADLSLSSLPAECENPGPRHLTLLDGEVADGSFPVVCRGRVAGSVVSSQGPLAGVTVTAHGTGISAPTDASGHYLLAGIEVAAVSLELSDLVGDCRTPPPISVTVPPGRTATAPDIHVGCTPLHVVFVAPGVGGSNDDLYIMKVDGTDRRQLTFTTEKESFPALSPDGTRIVFNRGETARSTIWTIGVDGTGETAEAGGTNSWPRPRWMYDGERLITFNQQGTNGQSDGQVGLYSFATPGAIPAPIEGFFGVIPTSAYTDSRIAYIGTVSMSVDHITLLDVDAPTPVEIPLPLNPHRQILRLNWAPDGSRIVFWERRTTTSGTTDRIVTRGTDPAGATLELTSGPRDRDPVYSPEGGMIYFIRGGAFYSMNADGSNPTEIVPQAEFLGTDIDVR